jgi:hypothetical protein
MTYGVDVDLTYSAIQGLFDFSTQEGNIGEDPMFADDDWRLLPGSPAIDAASNGRVAFDFADIDGDDITVEPTPLDLDLEERFVDDSDEVDTGQGRSPIVDMGPFEFQLLGELGDCDADGDMDLVDYSKFQICYTGPGGLVAADCACADFDSDGDVYLADFGSFQLAFTGPI